MTPRRVLLRIKKLRRFLDERISDAARRREAAAGDDAEDRAEAAGALEAYQRVRGEMVGERLDLDELELEEVSGAEAGAIQGEEAGPQEAKASDQTPGEEAGDAAEADEPEEAPAGG